MISRQQSIMSSALQPHTHPEKIGPWKLGKTLGRGATGRVLLGVHQTTGQKAAVKVVSKSELGDGDYSAHNPSGGAHNTNATPLPYGIEREIIIMKLLTHPNVLRLYDVWETSKALYLVLEYVEGGELFDLLVERGPLHEQEAVKYFRQIILGTAYCHALGICHRDLKPENLLLDASLNVKLADFGMAALESNGKLLETSCGLPHYAAPEIVSGLKYHGAASDVWSCGVILFALLTGRLPFDDENIRNLLLKVQAGSFEMPLELSPDAQDLIWRMLTVDPNDRISTSQVLSHGLLSKYTVPNEDLISVKSLPHPDTAHRSLGSRKNIDRQILENLVILWNKRSEEDIIRCLLADGANPEKTFYALLLRYRHTLDEALANYGAASSSPRKKLPRLTSSMSVTPKRNRMSQISASNSRNRPVLFQRRYGVKNASSGRDLNPPSVQNSPHKSPTRHTRPLPRPSPRKRHSFRPNDDPLPRNIYNDIVSASGGAGGAGGVGTNLYISIPPTLPSKDSIYAEATPATAVTDAFHEKQLLDAPKLVSKRTKRMLMAGSIATAASKLNLAGTASGNGNGTQGSSAMTKAHKRKSFRQSLTGLKRNSITIKLLSTYAKLSSETDWEYMDKQTKRTSATFATLCDKIFNHESYNEEDEKLIDEEEKKAREYEALMEIERKKHEAEFRARRELAKQKKRQSRRSILSLRKLHIIVTEDGSSDNVAGDAEVRNSDDDDGATAGKKISQPKRGSKLMQGRSVSETANQDSNDLTAADLELLKRRSATQPIPRRRQTPVLARRPVSRLDPLWIAFENKEITRAHDALTEEYADLERERARKQLNRELMVSVIDMNAQFGDDDNGVHDRNNDQIGNGYELPVHVSDDVNLSDAYMQEIRKLRLLNLQYNLQGLLNLDKAKRVSVASKRQANRRTLIDEVKIPKVVKDRASSATGASATNSNKATRSGNTSASQKRLSLISFRSTKELYRDLNSFLDTHREDLDADELAEVEQLGAPKLRTSFADRLDRVDSEELPDPLADLASVMDMDEHLANKRTSYYGGGMKPKLMLLKDLQSDSRRRNSKFGNSEREAKKTNGHVNGAVGVGAGADDVDVDAGADFTFSEEEPRRKSSGGDVFDKIKLPDSDKQKHTTAARKSASHRISAHQPRAAAMLVPNMNKVNQATAGSYGDLSFSESDQSLRSAKPIEVEKIRKNDGLKTEKGIGGKSGGANGGRTESQKENVPEKPRSRSIFRKMLWGTKKSLENPQQLPLPANSGQNSLEEKKGSLFSRIFSSSGSGDKPEVQRFHTILPKREIMTALFALLESWRNFGLKDLRKDMDGFNITGGVSGSNSFHMKGCKFRIKVAPASGGQKSELICAHVKGSKTTSQTLFKEIRKVLEREGVMDN